MVFYEWNRRQIIRTNGFSKYKPKAIWINNKERKKKNGSINEISITTATATKCVGNFFYIGTINELFFKETTTRQQKRWAIYPENRQSHKKKTHCFQINFSLASAISFIEAEWNSLYQPQKDRIAVRNTIFLFLFFIQFFSFDLLFLDLDKSLKKKWFETIFNLNMQTN